MDPRHVFRRLVLVLTLCALPMTALPLSAAHADTTDPTVTTVPLRVMTQNVQFNRPVGDILADVRKITGMADFAGLQETSDRAKRARIVEMLDEIGWNHWFPDPGGYENMAIWNDSVFSLESTRSVLTHGGQAGVTPPRYINTVILRHRATGKLIALVNTHAISQGARDGGRVTNERTARLKKHIGMLRDEIALARKTTPNVIATGDLNVNYLLDRKYKIAGLPTATLGSLVDFDMPIKPSWGGTALFDYVMRAKGSDLTRTSAMMIAARSDHDGVYVKYDLAGVEVPPYSRARFAAGRVVNKVRDTASERRLAVGMYVRAVNAAGPGEAIHLVSRYVTDVPVYNAILRAKQRGVHVQIVFTAPTLNSQAKRLMRAFGQNTSARSWAVGCNATCRRKATAMAPSELMVSQAGLTRATLITLTQPVSKLAVTRTTTARTTNDLANYNRSFDRFFGLVGR